MDKKRKKELREQYKRNEAAQARERLGLTAKQLRDLHCFLEDCLRGGCDHTPKFTREWANAANVDPDRLVAAVGEFGGYYDCEVVFNVTPDQFGWGPDREDA